MKNKLIIVAVIVLLVVGAGVYLLMQKPASPNTNTQNPEPNTSEQTTLSGTPIQTYDIKIGGFAFSPSELKIQPGDTVIWTNNDLMSHTITSDSGTELSSSSIGNGKTYSHTFNTIGTYSYHCSIHPSMKGQIIVE